MHEQSCILGSFERKRYDEVLGVEIVSILELEETLAIKYFKPLILDINKTRITGSKKIDWKNWEQNLDLLTLSQGCRTP